MKEVVKLRRVIVMVFSALILVGTCLQVFADAGSGSGSSEATIVSSGTTIWHYLDNNIAPVSDWNSNSGYDTTSWKAGTGSFGAKGGIAADLGVGFIPNVLLQQYIPTTTTDIPVFHFRTTFDVVDPELVTKLTGSMLYDDAAIIYINGVKVSGFDDSSFDASGYGGSNASEPKEGLIDFSGIASLNLKAQNNVLAVEIHQGRSSSSDIYFDMKELKLEVTLPTVTNEVKDMLLSVGADETQKNITWYGTSANSSNVQVVVKPENWISGDTFPGTEVEEYPAVQADTTLTGFKNNKATILNLKENTTYLYRVGNDDQWSETNSFITNSFGNNSDFNFLFAGDPQIGASGNSDNDTIGWNNTLVRSLNEFPRTSFLLSSGDQINDKNTSEETQYEGFLYPLAMRSISVATNVGNHDNGSIKYSEHYNMPNISELGTSTNTGAVSGDYWYTYNGVLFISINSNNSSIATHKQFMESVIQDHKADARWTVVSFHHSIFSVANHYSDADVQQLRTNLSPIFSDLGIDMVLMGHDHYYTRTYMMDGSNPVKPVGYDVTKGEVAPSRVTDPQKGQVLYITANSSSGSKYYSKNSQLSSGWPEYVAVQDQSNRQTISNVEITDTSLTISTYYTDQTNLTLMDSFTINKSPKMEPPVIQIPQVPVGEQETMEQGSTFDPMKSVGAVDSNGLNITDRIIVEGMVDTNTVGTYTLTYRVTDIQGNITTFVRTVIVKEALIDNQVPVFVMPELKFNTIELNSEFNPFEGVLANDSKDGDVTFRIFVTGAIDVTKEGTYTLVYSVSDKTGNETTFKRVLTVVGKNIVDTNNGSGNPQENPIQNDSGNPQVNPVQNEIGNPQDSLNQIDDGSQISSSQNNGVLTGDTVEIVSYVIFIAISGGILFLLPLRKKFNKTKLE